MSTHSCLICGAIQTQPHKNENNNWWRTVKCGSDGSYWLGESNIGTQILRKRVILKPENVEDDLKDSTVGYVCQPSWQRKDVKVQEGDRKLGLEQNDSLDLLKASNEEMNLKLEELKNKITLLEKEVERLRTKTRLDSSK